MSNIQKKIAKIRYLSPFINQDANSCDRLRQYNEYLYNQNRIEIIARCLTPYQQINQKIFIIFYSFKDQISNHINQYETNSFNTEIDKILSQLDKKKENIPKNILFSFKKHILSCNDSEQIKLYESMSGDQLTYISIKKKVKQKFRSLRRLSEKIKNLITCKSLQKIFISYLENSDKIWIQNSKIQNKETYKESINMILQVCKQNQFNSNFQNHDNQNQQF